MSVERLVDSRCPRSAHHVRARHHHLAHDLGGEVLDRLDERSSASSRAASSIRLRTLARVSSSISQARRTSRRRARRSTTHSTATRAAAHRVETATDDGAPTGAAVEADGFRVRERERPRQSLADENITRTPTRWRRRSSAHRGRRRSVSASPAATTPPRPQPSGDERVMPRQPRWRLRERRPRRPPRTPPVSARRRARPRRRYTPTEASAAGEPRPRPKMSYDEHDDGSPRGERATCSIRVRRRSTRNTRNTTIVSRNPSRPPNRVLRHVCVSDSTLTLATSEATKNASRNTCAIRRPERDRGRDTDRDAVCPDGHPPRATCPPSNALTTSTARHRPQASAMTVTCCGVPWTRTSCVCTRTGDPREEDDVTDSERDERRDEHRARRHVLRDLGDRVEALVATSTVASIAVFASSVTNTKRWRTAPRGTRGPLTRRTTPARARRRSPTA